MHFDLHVFTPPSFKAIEIYSYHILCILIKRDFQIKNKIMEFHFHRLILIPFIYSILSWGIFESLETV